MDFSRLSSRETNHKGHEGTQRGNFKIPSLWLQSLARDITKLRIGQTRASCSFVSCVVKSGVSYFRTSKLIVAPAATRWPAAGDCRTIIPGEPAALLLPPVTA